MAEHMSQLVPVQYLHIICSLMWRASRLFDLTQQQHWSAMLPAACIKLFCWWLEEGNVCADHLLGPYAAMTCAQTLSYTELAQASYAGQASPGLANNELPNGLQLEAFKVFRLASFQQSYNRGHDWCLLSAQPATLSSGCRGVAAAAAQNGGRIHLQGPLEQHPQHGWAVQAACNEEQL